MEGGGGRFGEGERLRVLNNNKQGLYVHYMAYIHGGGGGGGRGPRSSPGAN